MIKTKINDLINIEKEKNNNIYKIINKLDIDLNEKQRLIDNEVNKILNGNTHEIYTITPKVELLCKIITSHIKYFKDNNLSRVKKKDVKNLLHKICNNNNDMSLILLSIIGKIFTSINNNYISITNFAVLLCKYLIGSLTLVENYSENNILAPQDQLRIGMVFFRILDSEFYIKDKTFKLFINHDDISISLSDDGKEILRILPNFGNHHPLLVSPSNYSVTNQIIKDRIFTFNMYHMNCDCGIRKEHTKINESVISTLNYLQSQAFIINTKTLNDVLENPLIYLKEFDEHENILLPLYYDTLDQYFSYLINKYNTYFNKDKAKEKYKKGQELLDLFIKTIVHADIYKDNKIYFNTYLDWRGRIYYNGYPLNPQSYKLCRRLLKLNGSDTMCSFDVTASGFQIIGLLMNDKLLLEMTNFIKSSNNDDIYEYIMENYREYINKCLDQKDYPFILDEQFSKNIFNRNFIKNISMCLIYTEGNYSRANKIKEALINTSVDIQRKDLMKLAHLFKVCIYKSIPSINEISKYFSFILNKSNNLIYLQSSNKHISTVLSYPKQEIKRVTITKYPLLPIDKNGNIRITNNTILKEKKNLYTNIIPYRNDISKLKRSLFPNFIHQVDSLILHRVVQNAIERNISLYTIHDCFVSDIKNKNIINEIYMKACIDVITIDKPLQTLLNTNNCELTNRSPKSLKEIVEKDQYNDIILKEEIYDIITD